MRIVLLVLMLIFGISAKSQDTLYEEIPLAIYSKNSNGYINLKAGQGLNNLKFIVKTFLNVYNDNKQTIETRESAKAKAEIIKANYDSYGRYPDSINNGWHKVLVSDFQNFSKEAIVFVDQNKITEFVIDGCIRVGINSSLPIKDGRSMVTLIDFNGDEMELVNVYFMYDLQEPMLVSEPPQPAYICFWSDKWQYKNEKIIMGGLTYDGPKTTFVNQPKCFAYGTISMVLKPGEYSFVAQKKGNDKERWFVAKSGKCLVYRLQ